MAGVPPFFINAPGSVATVPTESIAANMPDGTSKQKVNDAGLVHPLVHCNIS